MKDLENNLHTTPMEIDEFVKHGDEPLSNQSSNPHFNEIVESALMSRRQMLGGSLGAAVLGILGVGSISTLAEAAPRLVPPNSAKVLNPTLGFMAVPVTRADTATLPSGYKAQVLAPWGTPLTGSYPAYDGVNGNSGAEQEQQVGSHHDGMHYFPMPDDPNGHGLLCVNHEYVDANVLNAGGPLLIAGQRPTDQVRKEIAAHGVSVIEIKRDATGHWDIVRGAYNRRVTANTPMEIRGPVRGSDLVKTKYSPDGTRTRGTINNCAHGYTPWGTYLTCEENWAGYFVQRVNQVRADALLNWFEDTQPAAYPGRKVSFIQGSYYARYYPETDRILGIFDEVQDQKPTNRVYTQAGAVFNDADRQDLGTLQELLQQAGIAEDLSLQRPREMARFGVPTVTSRYRWETAQSGEDQYARFDASVLAASATEDYRNEPNGQGWIVEIDPFKPSRMPVKRTALGRFAHEGVVFAQPQLGQPLVFYSGDDSQNEYIYKFVTKARYNGKQRGEILDEGTLYVARFANNFTGEWLALDIRDPRFRAAADAAGVTFKDQADVLVNTRLAADVVGATKMDRPEWGAVHPQTNEVYFTLTNSGRASTAVDAANPRGPNPTGHIIRWREQGNRPWATRFNWDLFVLSGPESASQVLPGKSGPALTPDNIHASPDGLWIDESGILWIQTDMSGSQQASGPFGANGMLAANPITGEIRRFLVGPNDQETTGVVMTPDRKTMFVNFQHPGDRSAPTAFTSNWPDGQPIYRHPTDPLPVSSPTGARPRSGTIVITHDDGGVIGL